MSTISVSDARAALPRLLERVRSGEEITLTRHGEPVAVLVRPDALRVRRADAALADADHLRQLLDESREAPLPEPALDPERAEELVDEVRAQRSRG